MNNQLTKQMTPGLVAELYEAMGVGDLRRARRVLAEDVVLRVPGTHPLAGEHRGPDGVLGFVLGSRHLTDGGEDVEVLDVLEGRDHVAVCCTVRATRAGRAPLENRTVHVLRLDGGRIREIWLHNFDDIAVNDFWS